MSWPERERGVIWPERERVRGVLARERMKGVLARAGIGVILARERTRGVLAREILGMFHFSLNHEQSVDFVLKASVSSSCQPCLPCRPDLLVAMLAMPTRSAGRHAQQHSPKCGATVQKMVRNRRVEPIEVWGG